jgi:hypothetical protein
MHSNNQEIFDYEDMKTGITACALICMVCLTVYYDILALKGLGK